MLAVLAGPMTNLVGMCYVPYADTANRAGLVDISFDYLPGSFPRSSLAPLLVFTTQQCGLIEEGDLGSTIR